MKNLLTVVAITTVLATEPSYGIDEDNKFTVFGVGHNRCSDFLELYSDSYADAGSYPAESEIGRYIGYLNGFLTGMNVSILGEQSYFEQPTKEAYAWLANYCRSNPTEYYIYAVYEYARSKWKGK